MRNAIVGLAGLALVGALVVPASAESYRSPSAYKQKKKYYRYAQPRYESSNRSDYHEYLADKLPIGSGEWFRQMEREGRFGGGRRN
jgi:hypothetical protein